VVSPRALRIAPALVAACVLLIGAAGAGAAGPKARVISVAHGAVTTSNSQYIDLGTPGASVGDLRTYYLPLARTGTTATVGYLTGTLTTVAVDQPAPGMELRTANLVFVIGRVSDQIVVGGVAEYTQTASTVAAKSTVTRPVIGGSGRFAGARGWCISTHLADNTWTHVFHLMR
jgi:hypothetical protein